MSSFGFTNPEEKYVRRFSRSTGIVGAFVENPARCSCASPGNCSLVGLDVQSGFGNMSIPTGNGALNVTGLKVVAAAKPMKFM
jgi:hypothetical protein